VRHPGDLTTIRKQVLEAGRNSPAACGSDGPAVEPAGVAESGRPPSSISNAANTPSQLSWPGGCNVQIILPAGVLRPRLPAVGEPCVSGRSLVRPVVRRWRRAGLLP